MDHHRSTQELFQEWSFGSIYPLNPTYKWCTHHLSTVFKFFWHNSTLSTTYHIRTIPSKSDKRHWFHERCDFCSWIWQSKAIFLCISNQWWWIYEDYFCCYSTTIPNRPLIACNWTNNAACCSFGKSQIHRTFGMLSVTGATKKNVSHKVLLCYFLHLCKVQVSSTERICIKDSTVTISFMTNRRESAGRMAKFC